ncbi:MAG: phosphoribosylanthranilate isomerase [Oscillospiraceae bacterium]|nr:phosphoribosylanthranilate isomerase [Oscillospiraceae bacterium]
MIDLKFCGMRRVEDIEYVNECRPDYVGFILSQGFKRTVSIEDFLILEKKLDKGIKKVGVFVNESPQNVLEIAEHLDVIQLHGDENEDYIKNLRKDFSGEIWKAVRAKSPEDIEREQKKSCEKLLIDSFSEDSVGGTGKRINTEIVKSAKIEKPFFIAGGITAENIAEIVRDTKPYGVDLSSGIETDGFKDLQKMKNIMRILREENLR